MLDSQHGNWSSALEAKAVNYFLLCFVRCGSMRACLSIVLRVALAGASCGTGNTHISFFAWLQISFIVAFAVSAIGLLLNIIGSNRRGRRPRGCPTELRVFGTVSVIVRCA